MVKDYLSEQYADQIEIPLRHVVIGRKERFARRYGITIALACAFTLYSIFLSAYVNHRAEKRLTAQYDAEYAQKMDDWIEEQRTEQSRQYFLSGDASREAAINQATDAVAGAISKLTTDPQKLTEACCMLARVMNPAFPNSFEAVVAEPQQWMFYDGTDKTFSQHDRELADSIVRPYMESGIIPNGLTSDMVYGAWSTNDFVLRDSYYNTAHMRTYRYQ